MINLLVLFRSSSLDTSSAKEMQQALGPGLTN